MWRRRLRPWQALSAGLAAVVTGMVAVNERRRRQKAERAEPAALPAGPPEPVSTGDADPAPPDAPAPRPLPGREECVELLEKMSLIRRFEERAGEMYARAKIGGFLHLAIGEEAAVVGAADAMADGDYLVSTYREHGQALARGSDPGKVMAELFGRADGVSKGHGGSMHLFDAERRFMGGYGIVGGNLPLATGLALASDYLGAGDATLCMFGDGAANQGTFGESLNLAALWRLPVVFMVMNNQFGMGTALERHSAQTDLSRRGEGFGVPGVRCDGMDVLDTRAVVAEALRAAREERRPQLVEAVTYRFRGHSMADPEEYRTREQVEEWRRRDPIETFAERLVTEGALERAEVEAIDRRAAELADAAAEFADASPFPELDALYDDLYAYGDQVRGWYAVDVRSPEPHRGERERESGALAHELAEAGAAQAARNEEADRAIRAEPGGQARRRDDQGGGD